MRAMPWSYESKHGKMHIELKVERPGRIADFVNNYGEYWFEEMIKTYSSSDMREHLAILEVCPVSGQLMYFNGMYAQAWYFEKQRDVQEAYEMWIDKQFEDKFLIEEGM
jgi:hypothetical protein